MFKEEYVKDMDELERIKREKLKRMMEKMTIKKIVMEVSDSNFQGNVITKSEKIPIVVDFWARWCAPCLILSPVLEKLAKEYNGKFILAKADVEENRQAAQRYNIRAIPAVKFFKNGKVVDEFIGVIPESAIRQWLDKNLK